MSATVGMISHWFDQGKEQSATHMIVVCDTFDYEDYPVYVPANKEVQEVIQEFDGINMQIVMEVYDLLLDKELQLSEHCAFHF